MEVEQTGWCHYCGAPTFDYFTYCDSSCAAADARHQDEMDEYRNGYDQE